VDGKDSLPEVTDVLKKDGVKKDDMEYLTVTALDDLFGLLKAGPQERLKENIELAKTAAKFIRQA
jgi:hypothetical protein